MLFPVGLYIDLVCPFDISFGGFRSHSSFLTRLFKIVVYVWVTQGFDEYMNLVLDDAEEVNIKKKSSKPLGQFLSCSFLYSPSFLSSPLEFHFCSVVELFEF